MENAIRIVGAVPLAGIMVGNSILDVQRKEIYLGPTVMTGVIGILVKFFLTYREISGSGMTLSSILGVMVIPLLPGICTAVISIITAGAVGLGDAIVLLMLGAWSDGERMLMAFLFTGMLLSAYSGFLFIKNRMKEISAVPFIMAGYLASVLITM